MEDYDSTSRVMNYLIKMPNRDGITGTGNAPQIFAAVADCLRSFVNTMHPKGFYFTAKQPSRQKLYDVLSKKIAAEFGWIVLSHAHETENGVKQYTVRQKYPREQ